MSWDFLATLYITMKNGITENYNEKNKSEKKIKLIVHILFIMFMCIESGMTFETPCICHTRSYILHFIHDFFWDIVAFLPS